MLPFEISYERIYALYQYFLPGNATQPTPTEIAIEYLQALLMFPVPAIFLVTNFILFFAIICHFLFRLCRGNVIEITISREHLQMLCEMLEREGQQRVAAAPQRPAEVQEGGGDGPLEPESEQARN